VDPPPCILQLIQVVLSVGDESIRKPPEIGIQTRMVAVCSYTNIASPPFPSLGFFLAVLALLSCLHLNQKRVKLHSEKKPKQHNKCYL